MEEGFEIYREDLNEWVREVWKPVVGYEGYYEVSNFGKIRSLRTYRCLFKVSWKNDYDSHMLTKNGIVKHKKTNRLVAEAFLEVPNHLKHIPIADLYVNHKNENKADDFVYVDEYGRVDLEKSNLEWCTPQYNVTYGTARERAKETRKNNRSLNVI